MIVGVRAAFGKSRGGKAWFDNMKETKSRPITPVTEKSLKKHNFFIVFGFTSVTLLCVIFFLFGCRIKTISVENTAIAEEEAILEAIGIKTGQTHICDQQGENRRGRGRNKPVYQSRNRKIAGFPRKSESW